MNLYTVAHLWSMNIFVYDKLWGPSQRVVTLLLIYYIYKEDKSVGKYKKESPSPSASALQHHMKEFLIARGGGAPII